MIYELSETLRELLEREMPIRKGDMDILFDLPKREWSSRLSKPTLNIFLFDFLENVDLRGSEQWEKLDNYDGTVSLHRNPVRMNFLYLITSWAKEIQDEQQLLSAALVTLLQQPYFPDDLLPDALKNQPVPIRLEVVQNRILSNLSEFWSTMENDPHPGIRLTITLSVDPYKPLTYTRVATSEIRFRQVPSPEMAALEDRDDKVKAVLSKTYFSVSGTIRSKKYSPSALRLKVAETGKEVSIEEDGQFKIRRLNEGEYHLDVLMDDRVLRHEKIQVPSPHYDIDV